MAELGLRAICFLLIGSNVENQVENIARDVIAAV
jgi:hypothetical protein